MGWRTGTAWKWEELKEERGWAQGSWGKDHQEEGYRSRRKRGRSQERAGLMGGSEAWELWLGNPPRVEPTRGGVTRGAGGGASEQSRGLAKKEGGAQKGGVAKEAGGWQRGLAGLGLQVAPVSGFSTRIQGQRRRAQVGTPVCAVVSPVPRFDHTRAAARPYKGPEMQSSLQIATGWQTWGKWGKECRAADLSKLTGSACSEHLTEGRGLPPECQCTTRALPTAPATP